MNQDSNLILVSCLAIGALFVCGILSTIILSFIKFPSQNSTDNSPNQVILKVSRFVSDNPLALGLVIFIFITSLILLTLLIAPFDGEWKETFKNVRVELIGATADLVLLFILVEVIRKRNDKRNRIRQYKEELSDYQGWNEPEAKHRVAGLVRRLIKEGVLLQEIDFSDLHLGLADSETIRHIIYREEIKILSFRGADLHQLVGNDISFHGVDMRDTRITNTHLAKPNFINCKMQNVVFGGVLIGGLFIGADLSNSSAHHKSIFAKSSFLSSNLTGSKFTSCNLQEVDFSLATLVKTKLYDCDLQGAKFFSSVIRGINLTNSPLDGVLVDNKDWLKNLKNQGVIGWEEITKDYYIEHLGTKSFLGTEIYRINRTSKKVVNKKKDASKKEL